MSNVAPGDIFAGGGVPYVNAETKAELARNKTPLGIVGASPKSRNQFGDDETSFIVKSKSLDGEHKIALSHNEVRERQAQAVCELLAGGATSVGPVYLVQVQTKSGKTAWALDNEPGSGEVEAMDATGTAGDKDDIPF